MAGSSYVDILVACATIWGVNCKDFNFKVVRLSPLNVNLAVDFFKAQPEEAFEFFRHMLLTGNRCCGYVATKCSWLIW